MAEARDIIAAGLFYAKNPAKEGSRIYSFLSTG
jgi:hypothetical protein